MSGGRCLQAGRGVEEGGPPENPQARVWAHLERLSGAQLSEVLDFGSEEAAGALGAVWQARV